MNTRTIMDLSEHRYYRLNAFAMKCFGLWPYQSSRVRYTLLTLISSFTATAMIPQVMAIVNNLDDSDLVIEGAASLSFCGFCLIKVFYLIYNSQKMMDILEHIRSDWEFWSEDREGLILHSYAKRGRRATVLGMSLCGPACTVFVFQPVVPKIIDVLLKNGTAHGRFPIPLDYCIIDMQKYYFYIILHFYVYTSLGFFLSLAYDTMFMVYVLHGCGLFSVLGHKLQRIIERERSAARSTNSIDKKFEHLEHLRSCVDRHNVAIDYAELVEAAYCWCFLAMMGINMLLISLTCVQIMKETVGLEDTIRFSVTAFVAGVLLFFDNYMGQLLMDHSTSIHSYIINSEWYTLPRKIQRFLLFILMRSTVPSKLTVGKVCVITIPTFTLLLKTSMSYLTLLRTL